MTENTIVVFMMGWLVGTFFGLIIGIGTLSKYLNEMMKDG